MFEESPNDLRVDKAMALIAISVLIIAPIYFVLIVLEALGYSTVYIVSSFFVTFVAEAFLIAYLAKKLGTDKEERKRDNFRFLIYTYTYHEDITLEFAQSCNLDLEEVYKKNKTLSEKNKIDFMMQLKSENKI